MGTVSVTGRKTCLVCGEALPRGWRDELAYSGRLF